VEDTRTRWARLLPTNGINLGRGARDARDVSKICERSGSSISTSAAPSRCARSDDGARCRINLG
jgi:hypothetical protein